MIVLDDKNYRLTLWMEEVRPAMTSPVRNELLPFDLFGTQH